MNVTKKKKKMAITGLLWIAIFDLFYKINQIMTKKIFFLQNTTHNGSSIKHPMNPKRKKKIVYGQKNFVSHILQISKKYRQSKSKNHQLLTHK